MGPSKWLSFDIRLRAQTKAQFDKLIENRSEWETGDADVVALITANANLYRDFLLEVE